MRRRVGFWILWVLAFVGLSGCAMEPYQRSGALKGAVIGAAVLGGVGAAVGPNFGDGDRSDIEDEQWQGAGIGAVAGALIGGVVGYALAREPLAASSTAPSRGY